MGKRFVFWLLWAGFIAYASFLAPPQQPGTFELVKDLSTGQWAGINPLIIALFNIMGVFPLIYICLLLGDGRGQKVRAWIFSVGSFGVGAFSLLPYLALRQPNPSFQGKKDWLLRLLDSRWLGAAIALGVFGLVGYGVSQGNWADFAEQWRTSRFIHVMSLDFCLLCLLFPTLLGDDMARRGLNSPRIFWAVSLVPLLGSAIYLVVRPPLPDLNEADLKPNSARSYSTSS